MGRGRRAALEDDGPPTPEPNLQEMKMSKKRSPKGKGNLEAESQLPSDPLDDILENLENKRGRLAGLQQLEQFLIKTDQQEHLNSRYETLTSCLTASVKKGSPQEAACSAKCLAIMGITLSSSQSEWLLDSAQPVLKQAVFMTGRPQAAAASAHALSMLAFIAASEAETQDIMELLTKAWNTGHSEVTCAALFGWALLSTQLRGMHKGRNFMRIQLLALVTFLGSENKEVQHAAHEAGAVLIEMYLEALAEPKTNGSYAFVDGAGIIADLWGPGDLGPDCSTPTMDQHLTQLLRLIEQVHLKPNRIKTPLKDVLVADSWTRQIQIGALQRCLGSGFVMHLQVNELLHAILDFAPSTGPRERLTAVEKRLRRDEAGKAKAVSRGRDRRASMTMKGSMLTDALTY